MRTASGVVAVVRPDPSRTSAGRTLVIGGGFGALAAAVRLAAAGHDVCLIEKGMSLGGRAGQYVLDGYRFDAGPTVLTAPHAFAELFALAGERLEDHVTLVPLDPFYRVLGADGEALDHRRDADLLLEEIARVSPGDRRGAAVLLRRISTIFDAFHPYTERPMIQARVMLAMLPFVLRHRAAESIRSLVRRHVRHPFVRSALEFHSLLIGGDPSRTPALYALIPEFERRWGVHYAVGGTATIVAALDGLLRRMGVEIRTGTSVERILTERGRVTGVRLAGGEVLAAGLVVSGADPVHTYDTLLRGGPSGSVGRIVSAMRRRLQRPSMSLHVLYFGTDRTWPHTDLVHHSILLPHDPDIALRRVFSPWRARRPSMAGRFLYVHLPTVTDPTLAPPGGSALYVLVAAPALRRAADRAEDHASVRADVVAALERHLPGFADHIVVEHAVGPEHFRSTLNSPYGSAFSLQPTLLQSAWFRPHNRSARVRGLYLVGAGTHPGAGVPAVLASGRIAADLIAADLAAGRITAEASTSRAGR